MLKGILLCGVVSVALVVLVIFGLYRPQLRRQTMEQAVSTGHVLAAQIGVAVRSVVGYSDFYVDSPELRAALACWEREPGEASQAAVSQVLEQMRPSGTADIHNVLIWKDGQVLAASEPLGQADLSMLEADWTFRVKDGTVQEEFSPFYSRNGDREEHSILYLRSFTAGGQRYTLGMVCGTEQMERDILRLSEGAFSGYAIATMEGPAFFRSGEQSNADQVLAQHTEDASFQERDSTGYYLAETISASGWKVIAYLSNSQFDARFTPVLTTSLLMCLLVCLVLVLLVVPFSHWLLKPIGVLRDGMERATQGDLTVRVAPEQRNEIGQLGEYFNHMLQEIQAAQAKELQAEHQTQQMKYELLSSQINTHYICNTMNSVNSLARLGRCDDVVRVNSALLRILQNQLRIREDEVFSTVQRELDAVQSYWSIESLHPNDQARFVVHADKEALLCPMLKSILQPLVENSLRHGLLDEDTGIISGTIWLTIARQGEELRLSVQDDGRGISAERLAQLNDPASIWQDDTQHIGIANIKKRLYFIFREKATVEITCQGGTRVEIICPSDRPAQEERPAWSAGEEKTGWYPQRGPAIGERPGGEQTNEWRRQ